LVQHLGVSNCFVIAMAKSIVSVGVLAFTTVAEELLEKIPLEVLPARARHGALARSGRFEDVDYSSSSSFTLSVPLDYNEPDGEQMNIRYFTDSSYWDTQSGPIFVSMGGEGGSGGARCSSECRQHRALAVSVEHRFYGQSLPSGSATGVETSKYKKGLKVEYNLRDTAAVIDHVQATMVNGNPRITMNFGGSYSGGTCAWMRQLFPNKTAGCVSSSGVVDAKLNMWEFDDQIGKAYASPDGEACPTALHAVMEAIERKFAAGEGATLKKQFDASNLIGTPQGDNDFRYGVADGAAMIDQYGGKAELCNAFKNLPSNPSDDERIANLKATLDDHYGQGSVGGGFYDSECVKTPNPPSHCASGVLGGVNDRSWRFQKCSELGYLQPAPTNQSAMRPSKLSLQDLLDQCDYCFGDGQSASLKENNAAFQSKFGGGEPASGTVGASNILFLDYSDDPWQRASVTQTTDPSLPFCLTTCDGCGHCGSGVPSSLHHCSDVRSQFITDTLSGGPAPAPTRDSVII